MPEQVRLGIREQQILDFVQRRTGLYIRNVQHTHAVAAIERAMRRSGSSDANNYIARLERDLSTLDDLIVELVVGETYFFRFPEQYRFLAETILPELATRLPASSVLRLWSAGCATGEEAYSLAIVLREAGLLGRSRLLATDISKQALEQGRRGIYQDWALRGEGRQRVEPHATSRDGFHHLLPEIRDAVHFAYVNLALDTYPTSANATGNQDVIFCRNVLIYLDPLAIERVAECLFDSLAPGGWLITAASDPLLDCHAPFETVSTPGGVYYRRPLEPAISADAASVIAGFTIGTAPPAPADEVDGSGHGSIIDMARKALAAGQYERAAELTADVTHQEEAGCLHIKALANVDTKRAQTACQAVLSQHPLSPELSYLQAVLLMEQRRDAEALAMIRRVLFLDRSQVIAHLTLGTLLRRAGDYSGAYRALRNARDLCQAEDATSYVPLTEDETFGSVHRSAVSQLAALDRASEATP